MKILTKNYAVTELNNQEAKETNGGGINWIAFGVFFLAGVLFGLTSDF